MKFLALEDESVYNQILWNKCRTQVFMDGIDGGRNEKFSKKKSHLLLLSVLQQQA